MGKTLSEIAQELKNSTKKIQLIYGFNGAGKTRLSREFKNLLAKEMRAEEEDVEASELSQKNIIYYNAFTEDLFFWDNDLSDDKDRKLKIHPNSFTKWVFQDQGQAPEIINHFQRLTNSSIEPRVSADFSEIYFSIRGDEHYSSIKISKGEESNLIWCIFYSFLYLIIEELSTPEKERSTHDFNNLKYVFIDDPVSSLDENHLIQLAVDLAKLVKSSSANLRFIISTHNPLFYNILSMELNNKLAKTTDSDNTELNKNITQKPDANKTDWLYKPKEATKYRLDKNADGTFFLTKLDGKTPFSYHLFLLSEIRIAIKTGYIKKYHFNFLRNIFEKTATFLGHDHWENLLPKSADGNTPDPLAHRVLNLYSHSAHAGEETGEVEESYKTKLKELVIFLSDKYQFLKEKTEEETEEETKDETKDE